MFLFKKQPPPKSKIPNWLLYITPIFILIISALVSITYNSIASDLKEVKESVKEVDQKKVDNITLQLMINNLKDQQQTIKETLQELKDIKKQQPVEKESITKEESKFSLTREKIKFYFSLTKEQRANLRKADPTYLLLPE